MLSAAALFQRAGDSKVAAITRSLSGGMTTISRGALAKSSAIVNQGVAAVGSAANGLGSLVARC